jgi:diacylglycerol kinase (ATP)
MGTAAADRIVLLVNPSAGGGRGATTARRLGEALQTVGVEPDALTWCDTRDTADVRRLAREAAEAGARSLVVVGGDGTVHHASRGLLDAPAPIPLAICAAGTGNDFVKNLSHDARDPVIVASIVARGTYHAVDVGVINGVPFLNAAGVGFDVDVAERMQRGPWLRGRARYLWHAGRALLRYPGFDATWTTAEPVRHLMVVFANGHTFGGSFRIAPDARPDDGQLDAVVIGDVPARDRPRLFFGALRGRHVRDPRVQVHRGTGFHLTAAAPFTVECDGELYALETRTLNVSVRPGALPLIG